MRSEFSELYFEFGEHRTAPLFIYLVHKKLPLSMTSTITLYLYYFFIIFFFYLIRKKTKHIWGTVTTVPPPTPLNLYVSHTSIFHFFFYALIFFLHLSFQNETLLLFHICIYFFHDLV